jgi:hypothetical protein
LNPFLRKIELIDKSKRSTMEKDLFMELYVIVPFNVFIWVMQCSEKRLQRKGRQLWFVGKVDRGFLKNDACNWL